MSTKLSTRIVTSAESTGKSRIGTSSLELAECVDGFRAFGEGFYECLSLGWIGMARPIEVGMVGSSLNCALLLQEVYDLLSLVLQSE